MKQVSPTPRTHHIGVQTVDVANAVSWYRDFFGCEPTWTLEEFSALTRSRLPGITKLTETVVGDLRFHLFEREDQAPAADPLSPQFQHVCLNVDSAEELRAWHERWLRVHRENRHTFLRAEPPTEIVVDAEGTQSFYCLDVNGLEFEFTYLPGVRSDG